MAKQVNFNGYLISGFGAYIRTDLTGLTDINGVGTGIVGIIGLAEKGPVNQAVEITSYTQLVGTFGDGPLVRHGLAAYVGGASTLVAIRTGSPAAASLSAIDASGGTIGANDNYTWDAIEKGSIGNNISVAVSYQNTADSSIDNDTYLVQIKYVDTRGNDMRETFILPRYIPNPSYSYTDPSGTTTTRYKFYDNNTTDYFILRNREDGTIREIPNTWGYGNVDIDAFKEKVSSLKSSSEDLMGPFPYDAAGNPYPLALIQSVVNFGGLGFAPSSLVTIGAVDPSIDSLLAGAVYNPANADQLITHAYVALSGGYNGDDGTNYYGLQSDPTDFSFTYSRSGAPYDTVMADSWEAALSVMENEDVNFVQPAYLFNYKTGSDTLNWTQRYGFFKTLMPLMLSHINTMSNTVNRKFRTMIAGLPYYKVGNTVDRTAADFLEDIQDVSGIINNDRVQLWAGGFKSRAFSTGVENYGGEMLASFVVGAQASREVSVSLTFARLAGIFTDGLEFSFNQAQKDELYKRATAFVMKRRNSSGVVEYIAAHNYTSFTGAPNAGLPLFVTRRIVDYMNSFIYKNLEENFIGTKSLGAQTSSRIADYVTSLLNRLVRDVILVAFANVNVYADSTDKTKYYVEFDFQPVTEVDFVLVTNKLLYTLA